MIELLTYFKSHLVFIIIAFLVMCWILVFGYVFAKVITQAVMTSYYSGKKHWINRALKEHKNKISKQ
jgi:hypothetical protein